jgi:hypothetical protein
MNDAQAWLNPPRRETLGQRLGLFRLSGVLLALILAAISGSLLGTCAAGVAYAEILVR